MNKIILVISFYAFILSCTDTNGTKQQSEISSDSVSTVTKISLTDTNVAGKKTSIQTREPSNDLATRILGTWALIGGENASFVIEKKAINYPETFTSYKYSLINDSIKIRYDDYIGSYLLRMKGPDTLILSGDEEQVYCRFKK